MKLQSKANLKRFMDHVGKGTKKEVEKIVELVTEKGLDPNFHDEFGETPIAVAAMADNIEVVTALVAGGAHFDFRSTDGLTSIHKAAIYGKHRT